MKTLTKIPMILALIMFIFCILLSSAHAEGFITFTNEPLTREERIIKLQVNKHKHYREGDSFDSNYYADVRAIDGVREAIQIVRCTGDCLELPKKENGKRYAKGN